MKKRMYIWRTLCSYAGWILVALGAVMAAGTGFAAGIPVIVISVPLILAAAVFDWMDAVLDHMAAIREGQAAILAQLTPPEPEPQPEPEPEAAQPAPPVSRDGGQIVSAFAAEPQQEHKPPEREDHMSEIKKYLKK